MKSYIIIPKPDNLDWNQIPIVKIDNCEWLPPVDVEARAQLCYDAEALYVRLSAREGNIRAEESGETGMPCLDSCLEFFFSPDPTKSTYFNIEFNPNGCMFLGIGTNRYDLIRLVPIKQNILDAKPAYTQEGWEVIYRIEASFIRRFFPDFQLISGGMMRANFYKCGSSTIQPHYYTWNPMTPGEEDFHRPQDFGKLYLA